MFIYLSIHVHTVDLRWQETVLKVYLKRQCSSKLLGRGDRAHMEGGDRAYLGRGDRMNLERGDECT